MKTRDTLSGLTNLIDNISFEQNPNVDRARDAILKADQEFRSFWGVIPGWTSGVDEDTKDVLIFIPLWELEKKISGKEKEKLYEILREKFKEANFEIIEEKDIGGDVYFHIGCASHCYILRSLL